MTNFKPILQEIKEFLNITFQEIDLWFDQEEGLREYQPLKGGWTINQILEHIFLTSHYLLILISKGSKKALKNASGLNLSEELKNYTFHRGKLTEIGIHQSFEWIRPEHMEPKGQNKISDTRNHLKEQLNQCLEYLETLKNGEGALYKTTMTVNDLGKIDVYEYIYFLGQHARRHITQMEKNKTEYDQLKKIQ